MNKKQWVFGILLIILIAAGYWVWQTLKAPKVAITDFKTCAAAGRPIMESYPRQCAYNGQTFSEYIGNGLEKASLITVSNPAPNQTIASPLAIAGQARGGWYFEAKFPVKLFDASNNLLAEGPATAIGEWTTDSFVPFNATLNFAPQPPSSTGTLTLYKSNMSELPANDDQLNIPIVF